MERSRTLVLWCPDWPAVAALQEEGRPGSAPAVVLSAGRVQVATAVARAGGIRVGMRRRDVQSRCPGVVVLRVDADRDARMFEPVAAAVEALVPGIEVLRPGLLACRVRGPARYFGSEIAAAERFVDAVEALDVECRIGIAGGVSVAVLAAHRSMIVPPGGDAAFCAGLPVAELARDPAIALPAWGELAGLLQRLGITTAGALAALPLNKVATRFGGDGVAMHRLASGLAERGLSRRHIDTDVAVVETCDPPLERVDTAAFVARALAERFHTRLAAAGLACIRLAISATTEHGETVSRIWRCTRPLTAAATADRLRWQLDGWLTGLARRTDGTGPGVSGTDGAGPRPGLRAAPRAGAITALRLEAIEAVDAGRIQYGLWGSDGVREHRARSAFARVQGLLGPDAVLGMALTGGRGAADRIAVVAWGEENAAKRDPAAPWPGALPSPSPARIAGAARANAVPARRGMPRSVSVCGEAGCRVAVTERGMLTEPPAVVEGRRVMSWAGPWLLDERWWAGTDPAAHWRTARMQVIPESGPPMLLEFGDRGWLLEAVYD
ncbi:MAG: hypothetical protein BGO26_02550 [Actinobacteria bacterium 69-20]|nr:MAG: hypothetical protein BGO26_02550 [Actinobacteria bacterium 69-20]